LPQDMEREPVSLEKKFRVCGSSSFTGDPVTV
jgi:hypothetical protein